MDDEQFNRRSVSLEVSTFLKKDREEHFFNLERQIIVAEQDTMEHSVSLFEVHIDCAEWIDYTTLESGKSLTEAIKRAEKDFQCKNPDKKPRYRVFAYLPSGTKVELPQELWFEYIC